MPKISLLPALSTVPAGAALAVVSGGVTYRVTREALISGLSGAGFPYTFSASTGDADPGAGTFRFDSGTIGSIAKLFIDLSAYAGGDVSDFLASLDDAIGTVKGFVWYRSLTDPTKWAQLKLTARTAGSGYDKLDVTVVDSGTGGLPTATAGDTILTFDAAPSGADLGIVNSSSASVTPAVSDSAVYYRLSNAAPTFAIPTNAAQPFPIGTVLIVVGTAGQVTADLSAVTAGAKPSDCNAKSRISGSSIALKKVATNTWDLSGDLEQT